MKRILSCLFVAIFLQGCDNDQNEFSIRGTWVEVDSEEWDGIGDTVTFTERGFIEDDFFFTGWEYAFESDVLTLFTDTASNTFQVKVISDQEMIIMNYHQRFYGAVVKNVRYKKLNE